jgi:hypothetical protein
VVRPLPQALGLLADFAPLLEQSVALRNYRLSSLRHQSSTIINHLVTRQLIINHSLIVHSVTHHSLITHSSSINKHSVINNQQ